MLELWYAVYMTMFVMIVVVVPWTLFFYEQDSDVSVFGKVVNSASWVGLDTTVHNVILRYFAVKTHSVDDSQCVACNQSDTRE